MFGWYVLSKYGYGQLLNTNLDNNNYQFQKVPLNILFYLIIFVPIVCSIIQLIAWYWFTLKGQWLKQIKNIRSKKEEKLNF